MPSHPNAAKKGQETGLHRFPCAACGGDLAFSPNAGGLECPHCGARESIDTSNAAPVLEHSFKAADAENAIDDQRAKAEAHLDTQCASCGAVIEFATDTHAAQCPYCATAVVADPILSRRHNPTGVLPFAVSEDAARDALGNWLGSLWFAPNGAAKYARKGRAMAGVYMPYWTYDAQTDTDYTGERGKDYYVTRTVGDKTVRTRKTRWRRVKGEVSRFFDDVLVPASHVLPRGDLNALEPWDLEELHPYAPEFVAGFNAEAYSITREEGFEVAREKMQAVIRRDIRFDIGGDRQRIHSMETYVFDLTFKQILLPVWAAAFKYRSKTYRVLINARTGRVTGERPYSTVKVAFAGLCAALALAVVFYMIYRAENG